MYILEALRRLEVKHGRERMKLRTKVLRGLEELEGKEWEWMGLIKMHYAHV